MCRWIREYANRKGWSCWVFTLFSFFVPPIRGGILALRLPERGGPNGVPQGTRPPEDPVMTGFCPHCTAALSTYTTNVDSEPTNIEVLVCAHCNKVLGVVGPARAEGRRVDVEEVADLLSVAASTDDDDEARTVFSVAIEKITSTVETVGEEAVLSNEQIEALVRLLFERLREQTRQRDRERPHRPE